MACDSDTIDDRAQSILAYERVGVYTVLATYMIDKRGENRRRDRHGDGGGIHGVGSSRRLNVHPNVGEQRVTEVGEDWRKWAKITRCSKSRL